MSDLEARMTAVIHGSWCKSETAHPGGVPDRAAALALIAAGFGDAALTPTVVDPLGVACPFCHAGVQERCFSQITGGILGIPHSSRMGLAAGR